MLVTNGIFHSITIPCFIAAFKVNHLSKTSNIKEVQVMVSGVTSVGLFFKYSPKRQRHLDTCINAYSAELKEVGKTPLRKDKLKLCVKLGGLSATQRWKILMTCILLCVTV